MNITHLKGMNQLLFPAIMIQNIYLDMKIKTITKLLGKKAFINQKHILILHLYPKM